MDIMTEQKGCTNKKRVYNFLVEYIKKNCFAPSVREICIGTKLSSTSTVNHYLRQLENEGKIQMKRNSPRAIRLVGYEIRKNNGE